jgi:diaminohydroxyphosphoribosylaminopyrimidine deaminase/5-amino-6-(5-phosphoribosylamino)uracil reductase
VSIITEDEKYMQRCLDLALMGHGNTFTNPMVGAVLVYNGTIIGEGYHRKYGEQHAEANAINSVRDKYLLKKSTLYVNLEPCSHSGKTPPCSELIIKNNISRIVIGTIDPNSIVSGKGVKKLRDHGVEVITGVLAAEAVKLNKSFFTYYNKKRPYIILKWAQSNDGFIDIDRNSKHKDEISWISNKTSRILVHKWRSEEHSILVGTTTALLDDPHLNTRYWTGNNPVRIVLDRSLRLPGTLKLFDGTLKTLVFTEKDAISSDNKEYIRVDFNVRLLEQVLNTLYKREIQSVIVEGGKMLIESFIRSNLWDEARIFIGNIGFRSGINAPEMKQKCDQQIILGDDKLQIFYNSKHIVSI